MISNLPLIHYYNFGWVDRFCQTKTSLFWLFPVNSRGLML